MVTGTKILTTDYQYAVLFSEPEATSLAGRRLDQARDVAVAVNGDINACDLGIFAMMTADGAVHLRVVGTTGQVPAKQAIRVNYALILAP